MSDNMKIWNEVRTPPPEALKKIQGGRLSGMTDISPMWRYKAMTEQFGPCGVGWKYEVIRVFSEPGSDGQVFGFAEIKLYTREKPDDTLPWSDPIPGVGGSMLIAEEYSKKKEKYILYSSDEAYKMAITDALSVAMKMIGVGADVYMGMMDGKPGAPPKDKPVVGTIEPKKGTDDKPLTEKQTLLKKIRDKCLEHANDDKDKFKEILHKVSEWKDKESGEIKREGVSNMTVLIELDMTVASLKVVYGHAKNYKPEVVEAANPDGSDIPY